MSQVKVTQLTVGNGTLSRSYMKLFYPLILCPFILACASAPQPNVTYVDPGSQGQVVQGTGIESQDIANAANQAAQSILSVPAIANAKTPPTILITPVTNRSSTPIDTSLYTMKLRGTLMQYASGKVRFLARDAAAAANEREQAMRQSGQVVTGDRASRAASSYDYILTAEISGIAEAGSKGQSDYFIVAFKLVDFNDILVWENQYEIKKEGKESVVYR